MLTIVVIFFIIFAVSAAKRAAREIKPDKVMTGSEYLKAYGTPAQNSDSSSATDSSLTARRDLLLDMINDIDNDLDICPPKDARKKLLKEKASLLGQLATVENKIAKLNK